MENALLNAGIKPVLIENALHWRYATKIFGKEEQVPEDKFQLLLESLRLSPSSMGLQPWKFVIVKKKTLRKEILKLSTNQKQITDASHLVILCSLLHINDAYINRLIKLDKKENEGRSALEEFKAVVTSFIESKSKEELKEWIGEQVYIALGFLLATCAMLHVDACPIEAFNHGKLNRLLNLHQHGVESKVIVAIGYRSEKDAYAKHKKIRWPAEEIMLII